MILDSDERRVMTQIVAVCNEISGWGLRANQGELASAVHVLQGFVIQRALGRIAPDEFGSWYVGSTERSEE